MLIKIYKILPSQFFEKKYYHLFTFETNPYLTIDLSNYFNNEVLFFFNTLATKRFKFMASCILRTKSSYY